MLDCPVKNLTHLHRGFYTFNTLLLGHGLKHSIKHLDLTFHTLLERAVQVVELVVGIHDLLGQVLRVLLQHELVHLVGDQRLRSCVLNFVELGVQRILKFRL